MGVMAGTPRTAAGRALALGGAAVGCGALATVLATRVAALAGHATGVRADELVELAVLGAGVLVLAWLAGSSALAAACLTVRGAGRAWRRGEGWVQRFAPALVRRALVVVVATGLGAASVTAASATDLPPTTSPTAFATLATPAADDAGLDLGWAATGAPPPSASPAPGPAVSAPATAPVPADDAVATPTPPGGVDTGWVPSGPIAPAPVPSEPGSERPSAPSPAGASRSTPAAAGGAATGSAGPGVAGEAAPAAATSSPGTAGTTVRTWSDALPVPRVPLSPPVRRAPAEDETVVVVRGDTLWDIAARHLPDGASDVEVAAAWPAWYAANAATIGPDPGLILPGQMLVVPVEVAR